jgi:hypothetical protein
MIGKQERSVWHGVGDGDCESNGLGIDHLDRAMLLGRPLNDEVPPLVCSMLKARSALVEKVS